MHNLYKNTPRESHIGRFRQCETAKEGVSPSFYIHQYSLTTALTRPMISASVPSMGS